MDLLTSQATNIDGDESVGSNNKTNIQPLRSLEIADQTLGSFKFTFASNNGTDPGYWNDKKIRLYKKNSVTIKAPSGVNFNKITATAGSQTIEMYSGNATNECTYTHPADAKSNPQITKFTVTLASTELGNIQYDGADVADEATYSGVKEQVFTFTAANADNMEITADEGTVSDFTDGAISWKAPDTTGAFSFIVTATKGTESKNVWVTVTIAAAPLCGSVVFTPGAGEITKGSYVTMTCENATQIKYWLSTNPTYVGTVPVADAKIKIDENCTLHAIGINADEVEGTETIAEYTVLEISEPDVLSVESMNISGNGYQYSDYTSQTSGAKYWYKIYQNKGMQINTQKNNSAEGSGLALIEAPTNKVIAKIEVSIADNTNLVVKFDNTAALLTDNKLPLDPNGTDYSARGTKDGDVYTYIPTGDYKNFTITSKANLVVTEVKVYFKDMPETVTPDAPSLHSDVTIEDGTIKGTTLKFNEIPEGHSIWWRIVPEVAETPGEGMAKEEVAFQKYTEPVTLTAGTKGTLHFYAQHDATGGQSATNTDYKVNVPDVGSGIAGIVAENGEAVYFNLQGVRVDNPTKGLYIRVANGKSQKVMM